MKMNIIKNAAVAVLGFGAIAIPAASFAAATLKNGGLGQPAGNTENFGVAVCNQGTKTLAGAVPVMVAANGETASVESAAPIKPGGCAYSYLSYAELGMQAGRTYSVAVTINGNDRATYSVTVPVASAAAAPSPQTRETADVSAQSNGFWAQFVNFLSHLFGK